MSWTWHAVGAQTVIAGTFSDCWHLAPAGIDSTFYTYCRGVGLVRFEGLALCGS